MNRERHLLVVPAPARSVLVALALFAVTLFLSAISAPAQFTPGMKISNFSASDPYPAPDYKQMRYVVTGAEGRPQADKTFLLTGLKLQTFRVNGQLEMTVEAPECTFNDKARTADSTGKLTLQSGDGKLRVEGVGFDCQLAGQILIISNDVRAVIVRPNTNANAAPLVITSRWLEFDGKKGRAIFHNDVRGDDPDFAFTCGTLLVSGTATNGSSFDLIEARDSLVVTGKAGVRRASADRGVYRAAEENVELVGNATWDVDGRSGRANRVLGLRKDGSIQAEGGVAMKLPRGAMGAATGLLSASNAVSSSALLDVFADKFYWRSNALTGVTLTGVGAVRIVDPTNRVSFACDTLEARQAAEDETAMATGNVKVERDDGANVLANRADYSKRAGAVVFTGNPRWRQEQIQGSADRVTFKPATEEVAADQNVAVKITVPAKGGGSMLTIFPQGATNQTAQVIEIAARRLNVKQGQALFTGDVGAFQSPRTGSEPRLHSDKLEVLFAPGGGRLDAITARDNVTCEQNTPGMTNYSKLTCRSLVAKTDPESGDPKELVADGGVRIEDAGSRSVARSAQMVYNRQTEILKLIGQPVIEMPQGTYTGKHEVEWNKKENTVSGADYKITGNSETVNLLKKASESPKLPGQ